MAGPDAMDFGMRYRGRPRRGDEVPRLAAIAGLLTGPARSRIAHHRLLSEVEGRARIYRLRPSPPEVAFHAVDKPCYASELFS